MNLQDDKIYKVELPNGNYQLIKGKYLKQIIKDCADNVRAIKENN